MFFLRTGKSIYTITFLLALLAAVMGYEISTSEPGIPFQWKQFLFEEAAPFDINRVNHLTIDNDTLWICTGAGVIGRTLDGKLAAHYINIDYTFGSQSIREMAIDKKGNKWFATQASVFMFDGIQWVKHDSVWANHITSGADGTIWASADSVIKKFDGKKWTTVSDVYRPRDIKCDSNGALWLVEYRKLVKFDGCTWVEFSFPDTLYINSNHLKIDTQDKIWLYGYGIASFENGNWEVINTVWKNRSPPYQSSSGVNSIDIDVNGNIWYASCEGGGVYTGDTWVPFTGKAEHLNSVVAGDNGKIWFGDYRAGGVFGVSYSTNESQPSITWAKTSDFCVGSYPVTIFTIDETIIAINITYGQFRVSSNFGTDWDVPKYNNTELNCNDALITLKNGSLWISKNNELFTSDDHGKTWYTAVGTPPVFDTLYWINMEHEIGRELSEEPTILGERCNSIKVNSKQKSTFAVNTGAFYSDTITNKWLPINRGLPVHTPLNIVRCGNYILAAASDGIYRISTDISPDPVKAESNLQQKPGTSNVILKKNQAVISVNTNSVVRITIYSINGRLIYTRNDNVSTGTNSIPLFKQGSQNGTYIVTIQTPDQLVNYSGKFVYTGQ